jgi:hypothetical protein
MAGRDKTASGFPPVHPAKKNMVDLGLAVRETHRMQAQGNVIQNFPHSRVVGSAAHKIEIPSHHDPVHPFGAGQKLFQLGGLVLVFPENTFMVG